MHPANTYFDKEQYRVKIHHYIAPKNCAWYTHVDVYDRNTNTLIVTGYSQCNKKDQPSRKMGREIALGRARKALDQLVSGDAHE